MAGGVALQKETILVSMGAVGTPWAATQAHALNRNGTPILPNRFHVNSVLIQDSSGWRSIPSSCAVITGTTINDVTVQMAPAAEWNDAPLDALVEVILEDVHTIVGLHQQVALGAPPPAFNTVSETDISEIVADMFGRHMTDEWEDHDFLVDPNGPNGWTYVAPATVVPDHVRFAGNDLEMRIDWSSAPPPGNEIGYLYKDYETLLPLAVIAPYLLMSKGNLTIHAFGVNTAGVRWEIRDGDNTADYLIANYNVDGAGTQTSQLQWGLCGISGNSGTVGRAWAGARAMMMESNGSTQAFLDDVVAPGTYMDAHRLDADGAAATYKRYTRNRSIPGKIQVRFAVYGNTGSTADIEMEMVDGDLGAGPLDPSV